jgi:5-formyltetrahydrofolate cyclo-ligase
MSTRQPAIADRKTLRTRLREQRRALPAAQRIAAAQVLAGRLLTLPFAPGEGFVAGYWAMDGEIALHAWQLALPAGVTYCLPVLHDDRCLRFAPWHAGQPLVQNRYGIPEPQVEADALLAPEAMRLVVLPLVGFDTRGQRLGMGAGWYDRSFAFRRESPAPPWLVGAGFAFQQLESIEAASWDVALDAICTESDTHLVTGTAPA